MKKTSNNWWLLSLAVWSAASACMAASALFPVTVGGRWGFVDKSGQTVINPQFDRAEVFADGLAPVRMGRWGYVDPSGKVVINPQFDNAAVFIIKYHMHIIKWDKDYRNVHMKNVVNLHLLK